MHQQKCQKEGLRSDDDAIVVSTTLLRVAINLQTKILHSKNGAANKKMHPRLAFRLKRLGIDVPLDRCNAEALGRAPTRLE